ncbi:MAG: BadF/BadG/BcrA/BcrD ATPase family protein [Anaerolineae bacterium]
MLVMGIDGGGTGVRVVLAGRDLVVLGYGEAGGVNPNVQTAEGASANLKTAMQQAFVMAQLEPAAVTAVCAGIAGSSSSDSSGDWLRRALHDVVPQARVIISGDAEVALVGAHGAACGVMVMAGTGSVAYGINRQGKHARAGGYGFLLGDEGSGYWLGREAIAAVVRIFYEKEAPTRLTELVVSTLGVKAPDYVIEWMYANRADRNKIIASLAQPLLECAGEGDAAAVDIVERGATALSQLVNSILRQLDDTTLPVAFGGSILTRSAVMSELLRKQLKLETIPTPKYPPAVGAVLLAVIQESAEKQ